MCKYVKPLINLLLRWASNAPFDVSLVTNSISPWILSNLLFLCCVGAFFLRSFFAFSCSTLSNDTHLRERIYSVYQIRMNEYIHNRAWSLCCVIICDTYFVISLTLAILLYYYYCYRYVNKHRLIKLLPIRTIWDCNVCFMNAV